MAKSLPLFPNAQIYIPKKGQQKVPFLGTRNEEVQGGKDGCALEMGLSP